MLNTFIVEVYMKKIAICLSLLIVFYNYILNAQSSIDSTTDDDGSIESEIKLLKEEISTIKNEVDILKKRTDWLTLKTEGSIKITWGAAIMAKYDTNWQEKNNNYKPNESPYTFNNSTPIANGFDFENNLKFHMNLGNNIVDSSYSKGNLGTQISIEVQIDSLGLRNIEPRGSWYKIEAVDDQDNSTDIYLPRYDRGDSSAFFGNFQIALKEAKVKNIIGSGFFINYADVKEVHHYYGVNSIVDILTLNHDYFNNGFITDPSPSINYTMEATTDIGVHPTASVFYSFDDEDYDPESHVSEAVKLWSNNMLRDDPLTSDYNQKPHGISIGYDKKLTQGFHLYMELGASSKDAFDPKYFKDDHIDYGFFARLEPRFYLDQKFDFHPKIAVSFAFQTETIEDKSWEFSTYAMGLSIPLILTLPTSGKDYLKLEGNWNMNVHIATAQFATILSFFPELKILQNKLSLSLPIIYSFKNYGRGGFLRVGNQVVKITDQVYDDHVFQMGFIAGFDSQKLFGSVFQYKVTNKIYYAYLLQNDPAFYSWEHNLDGAEYYFFELLSNEFILNNMGPDKLAFFFNFGVGYNKNARLVYNDFDERFTYDANENKLTDTQPELEVTPWKRSQHHMTVLSFDVGFYMDIFKNLSMGLTVESPKIAISEETPNVLGDQQSYAVFKLWSEIKF